MKAIAQATSTAFGPSGHALCAALIVVACLTTGCSWLVDPDTTSPRCVQKDGEKDPCPTGTACMDGRCEFVSCTEIEICADRRDNDCDGETDEEIDAGLEKCGDMIDNDCDGKTDEREDINQLERCGNWIDDDCDTRVDEGHDQDLDGTTWCGDTAVAGGKDKDCDDLDPTASPTKPEICDGRDNDCDYRTDETTTTPLCEPGFECIDQRCSIPDCTLNGSGSECPTGQRCDMGTRRCVPLGCTPGSCDPPLLCDQQTGTCRADRRPNGDPCVANSDCMSGSCTDRGALRIRLEASRLCTQACCSDADCLANERCYVSGSGARSCLPTSLVPRDRGDRDQCLADEQCAGNEICRMVPNQTLGPPADPVRNNLLSPACSESTFGLDTGDACGGDVATCASGVCVTGAGLFPPNVCSKVCGSSKDCDELEGEVLGLNPRSYCRFVQWPTSRDLFPICVLIRNDGSSGGGEFGAQCANGLACAEGACIGASGETPGRCSVACCKTSDCPSLNGEPTVCRAVAFGEHFEMRCVP